jgi:two-component sensor histidine kinase
MKTLSFNPRIRNGPLRNLSLLQGLIALVLACLAVAYIRQFLYFSTSTEVLLARLIGASLAVLLAFTLASNISLRWLPRQIARTLAIVIVSPLALAVAYTFTADGTIAEIWSREPIVSGWMRMSLLAVVVGLLSTLTFIYYERDREAKEQALRHALERQTLEKELLAAELKALQAQIEPHFLFNTLANVQQLVEMQSPQAAPLLKTLIRYLKLALSNSKDQVTTVATEFELARNYLAIMQMRMPDRLQFEVSMPDTLRTATLPPLSVMTLVENAVKHGIDPTERGGRIEVNASSANDELLLQVSDTGAGLVQRKGVDGGTGLAHLRERLQVQYAGTAQLELEENTPRGVVARLRLPIEKSKA